MPALFGPCQAAWIRRVVEIFLRPPLDTRMAERMAPETVVTMLRQFYAE